MVNSGSYGTVLDTTYAATFTITGKDQALTVRFPGFDGSEQKIDLTRSYDGQSSDDTIRYNNDFRYSDDTYAYLTRYPLSHTFSYNSIKSVNPSGGGHKWQYSIQSN